MCTIFRLAPSTVYEFRVLAETAVGGGPFSASRSFTTSESGMIIISYLRGLNLVDT